MIVNAFIFSFFIIAIIYTFKYRFIQFKFIKESTKALKEERTSLSAFLMTLASHLGAGNIVGVTTALIYGGPGSLFWMIISCSFISIFSLMENTLAVKYHEVINGEYRGGTCYYIKNGLHNPKLALIFCFFLLLANTIFFGPLQVNTISESLKIPFNLDNKVIIIFLVLFAFLVIFRGTKSILRFIEKLVPLMTIVFFGVSISTILYNIKYLPHVCSLILKDAFSFRSISGALLGDALIIGLKRSAFSNEAGLGTAPTLSSMSKIKSPIAQAFVQVLGAFVDTALMCTLMGLMILVYDIELSMFEGCSLAVYIFEVIFSDIGMHLGSFLLFTFAIATWVSSYYVGETNMLYLSQNLHMKKKLIHNIYKGLFIITTISGVLLSGKAVWDFIDYGMMFLGTINLYAIIKLEKVFKNELEIYFNMK
ncbi:MAG TPA: amino acid carrier protein [Bacilli bacterium]